MDEAKWLASGEPGAMLEWLSEPEVAAVGRTAAAPPLVSGTIQIPAGALVSVGVSRTSARKLRLFACACCRAVWHLLTDARSRSAVEVAERFADGGATEGEAQAADLTATAAFNEAAGSVKNAKAIRAAMWTSAVQLDLSMVQIYLDALLAPAIQAALLRDVFNPFRPVTLPLCRRCWRCGCVEDVSDRRASLCKCGIWIDAEPFCPWLTPTVVSVAQSAHDTREWDRLPILADALGDAGCEDEALLRHLRGWERCPAAPPRWDHSPVRPGNQWPRCVASPPCDGSGWVPLRGPHVRGCWALDCLLGLS